MTLAFLIQTFELNVISYVAFKLYVYNEIWTDCKLGAKLDFYMM